MAVSRSYQTGRTHTFVATAILELDFCGGTFVGGVPNYLDPTDPFYGTVLSSPQDSAWVGSNFAHPRTREGGLATNPPGGDLDAGSGHDITFFAFGQTVTLVSSRVLVIPGASVGGYNLFTSVMVNSTVAQRWNSGPHDNTDITDPSLSSYALPISQPPETLQAVVTISVPCAEWVDEIDGGIMVDHTTASGVRPASPYDAQLSVYWVPTGPAQISVGGTASYTGTQAVPSPLQTPTDFALIVTASSSEPWPADSAAYFKPLPTTAGKASIPFPGPFARITNLSMDGPVDTWAISKTATDGTGFGHPNPLTVSHITAYDFTQEGPFTNPGWEMVGTPRLELPIHGVVIDWNGLLYNVPIQFNGGGTYLFSRDIAIDDQPVPYVEPPAGYQASDTGSAVLRYGEGWDAITLDRAASLTVEAFQAVGGSNGWLGTSCSSGPAVSGDEIVATGAGAGSPNVHKTLKSDYADISADPGGWWATHGGNFDAITDPTQKALIRSWWATTGSPGGSPHVGDWWKVGRRLLAGSDVFNWSSFRYLDFTGHADSACTVTLKVNYNETYFEETSPYVVIEHPTPKTVSFAVALGTSRATQRIDLAGLAGQDGLRYVTSLEVDFPNGRTIHLHALALAENSRPVVDVHLPSTDTSFVTAMEDGKHCLFLSTRNGGPPNSLWGWPCLRRSNFTLDGTGDSRFQSLTFQELATEIGLQEGWTATLATDTTADHNNPGYATQLEETFEEALPTTLGGRRGFAQATVYPHGGRLGSLSLDLECNLGNAVQVLAFDPSTHLPVRVPIEADDPGSVVRDTAVTDSVGHGRLELAAEQSYTIWAGKGTASQSSGSLQTLNRTLGFPALTASEDTGSGGVSFDIDRLGNFWVTFVPASGTNAGKVTLARQFTDRSGWEYIPLFAGSEPWVKVSEVTAESTIYVVYREGSSTIRLATNTSNGKGLWKVQTIGSGTNPTILVDKSSGRQLFAYYRSGNVYMKRSEDGGASFLESEYTVLTGLGSAIAVPLDFDESHNVILVYSDGTNVISKVSQDNGKTFT